MLWSAADATPAAFRVDHTMSTITDPWPPADPTLPLPFDQRGCCWPWGLNGPVEKVAMRFAAIGLRAGGPVGSAWGRWATGQMFLVFLPYTNLTRFWSQGGESFLPFQTDWLEVLFVPVQNRWVWNIDSVISTPPPVTLLANGYQPTGGYFDPFDVPITSSAGAANPPDRIRVTPLPWYASSPYPYLGPP